MFAIKFKSALRNGKAGLVSGQFLDFNIVPASVQQEVKIFATDIQAKKYAEKYLQPGEQPVIVTYIDTLNKEFYQ